LITIHINIYPQGTAERNPGLYPYTGEGHDVDMLRPSRVAVCYGLLGALPATGEWMDQATEIWRRTPLMLASANGHEEIVKLLPSRNDVDIGTQDLDGETALFAVSRNGREGIVRLLCRNDVDIYKKDSCCQIALFAASENGHQGIGKQLLSGNDVNINTQNSEGETALFAASKRGHRSNCQIASCSK
jgi:hypothetical protein